MLSTIIFSQQRVECGWRRGDWMCVLLLRTCLSVRLSVLSVCLHSALLVTGCLSLLVSPVFAPVSLFLMDVRLSSGAFCPKL